MSEGALDTFESTAVESQMSGDPDTTISVTGGSPNFDDLDSIEQARESFKESRGIKNKSDSEPKKEAKKESKKKEAKEPKEDVAVVEKKVDMESMSPDPNAAEIKMMQLMDGDNPIEINADSTIPITIDGEETSISIDELRNQFSGKVAYDKRFQELNSARKSFETDRNSFMEKVTEFQKMYNGDVEGKGAVDAMLYLVDSLGGNSHNFYKGLRQELVPRMEEYLMMSDDQRAAYDAQRENEFLQNQLQSREERYAQEQSSRELESQIARVREAVGVDEDGFNEALNELRGLEVPQDSMTPEYVELCGRFSI
jgi:hypothetical protein